MATETREERLRRPGVAQRQPRHAGPPGAGPRRAGPARRAAHPVLHQAAADHGHPYRRGLDHRLGRLDYAEVRELAVKGGSVLLLLWAVAILLVLLAVLPDWPTRSSEELIETADALDFLELYEPFFSLANTIVPAVVVFSTAIGLALTGVKNKQVIIEPLLALGET